jgi:hypothetical protein
LFFTTVVNLFSRYCTVDGPEYILSPLFLLMERAACGCVQVHASSKDVVISCCSIQYDSILFGRDFKFLGIFLFSDCALNSFPFHFISFQFHIISFHFISISLHFVCFCVVLASYFGVNLISLLVTLPRRLESSNLY